MNITEIQELIQLGLQVFETVWGLFHKSVPTTAAQHITTTLQSAPGLSDTHKTVIASAVNAAAEATNAQNSGSTS